MNRIVKNKTDLKLLCSACHKSVFSDDHWAECQNGKLVPTLPIQGSLGVSQVFQPGFFFQIMFSKIHLNVFACKLEKIMCLQRWSCGALYTMVGWISWANFLIVLKYCIILFWTCICMHSTFLNSFLEIVSLYVFSS